MSDRTYYRLALPTTITDEAIRVAASAFTDVEWRTDDVTQLREHTLSGHPVLIDIEERVVGEARDAAEAVLAALTEVGADVPFTVTEDPCYEWLGTMCRYHPEKGMHEVDCDANATAVITATHVELLAAAGDPEDFLPRLRAHLGAAWVACP